ncbi:GAF domain-containing protein [Microcella sp.]|uniref:GAF domain-containing protein n=1 Tax=Microcella sp. TaxID=1913979 RepID=UPI00391CE3F5
MALVTELARDLVGRFELGPLLARILSHATGLLGCESGSISLVDEVAGTYTKAADYGVGCQEGQTFPLNEGFTGEIVRQRQTVILDDYSRISAGHIASDDPRWRCAVIGVPLMWDDRIIGACVVFSSMPGHVFTTDDAKIVELFASQAAIAIANSELHTAAVERDQERAISAERERAVRDVHETVGRSLTQLLITLDQAETAGADGRRVTEHLRQARAIAHDAMTESRRMVLGQGAYADADRDLEADIARELEWAGTACDAITGLRTVGTSRPLAPTAAHQAYAIAQEAISNAVAHARASAIRVGIIYGQEEVTLLIEDDGRGFDHRAIHDEGSGLASGCLGLHGMASRATHLGGELSIESTPGWGTVVRARIPDNGTPSAPLADQRWTTIIASDQPITSAGIVRLLHQHEPSVHVMAEVRTVADLLEALELVRPDVALVDIDMLHGEASAELARMRDRGISTVLVALTDNPTVDQVRTATQANVRGYIDRKSSPESIVRTIIAAAQGDAMLDSSIFESLTQTFRAQTPPVAAGDAPTSRELEVRDMIAQGMADKQIATALNISVKTVEKHVGSLLRKSGARNRTMLIAQMQQ